MHERSSIETILFVCKGNICRSPFAEELLREYTRGTPTINIESAGYFPKDNRTCPELATKTARNWNVSLSQHRSRILNDTLLRGADSVYIFDYQNLDYLQTHFTPFLGKVKLLGTINSGSPAIDDPWNQDESFYITIYSRIAKEVQVIAKDISTRHGA